MLGTTGCDAVAEYQESLAKAKARHALDEGRTAEAAQRESEEAKGEVFRAHGPGFSLPVPAGYSAVPLPKVAEASGRAVTLAAVAPANPDWFLPSIVVTPTGQAERTDAAMCKETAATMKQQGWTVAGSRMVEIGNTTQCQIRGVNRGEANRSSTMTVLDAASEVWVATCNYDTRDDAAQTTCEATLQGWRIEADDRS